MSCFLMRARLCFDISLRRSLSVRILVSFLAMVVKSFGSQR